MADGSPRLWNGPEVADRVMQAVCDSHPTANITPADILGRSTLRDVVFARHAAIYIVRVLGPYSYPAVARMFNRDHSTCWYACKEVRKALERGGLLHEIVIRTLRELQQG